MMNHSQMKPDWVRQSCLQNPIRLLDNGNILTCPVRLSWPNLYKPGKPMNKEAEGKYGATLLFPPQSVGIDFTPMLSEINKVLAAKFAQHYVPQTGQYAGVYTPFRDQAEKIKHEGYTPGSYFVTATSRFKPSNSLGAVDSRMNPIVDENRVYPGVWAICALNVYDFGISPPQPKKGVSFGLQSVMIIADDLRLGGGGSDPATDFANVKVTGQMDVAGQFGLMPSAGTGMPGMPPPVHPAGHGPGGVAPITLADIM